jgi:hypothetical protein
MGPATRAVYRCSEQSGVATSTQARHAVGVVNRRPQLKLIAPSVSPEEAAAVVAAVERFMRATAPALAPRKEGVDPWRQAAILEGVSREHRGDVPDPWINT